jgi:hypothetical protein
MIFRVDEAELQENLNDDNAATCRAVLLTALPTSRRAGSHTAHPADLDQSIPVSTRIPFASLTRAFGSSSMSTVYIVAIKYWKYGSKRPVMGERSQEYM